ncbi:MAG: hypothetical protein ACYTG0_36100 [Planctomycetota bacterium]
MVISGDRRRPTWLKQTGQNAKESLAEPFSPGVPSTLLHGSPSYLASLRWATNLPAPLIDAVPTPAGAPHPT